MTGYFGWIWKNFPILRNYLLWYPGHYYSPVPSLKDLKRYQEKIFSKKDEIYAIDLNESNQIELLNKFKSYYSEIPFEEHKKKNLRYYFDNPFYSFGDGIFLYCMMRHVKPKKIIEIGSGFSSANMLDTNELFFNGEISIKFVEPYPNRLKSLLKKDDLNKVTLFESKLQDVDLSIFKELQENDILFIDSSHVTKTFSDVNIIIFNILPTLNKGVYIHFHDIFFPFEYPKSWVLGGYAFNEAYILRAFLEFNEAFSIVLFNSLIGYKYKSILEKDFPLCRKNCGGGIWLRKLK